MDSSNNYTSSRRRSTIPKDVNIFLTNYITNIEESLLLMDSDNKETQCDVLQNQIDKQNKQSNGNTITHTPANSTLVEKARDYIIGALGLRSDSFDLDDNKGEKSCFFNPFTWCLSWLKQKCGGDDVFGAAVSLFFILLDWCLDIGTAANHFANGAWISGTLTYLVVLTCGIVTTAGFLKYPDIRKTLHNDLISVGRWLLPFLYCPSWLPFVCVFLKLHYLIREKKEILVLGSDKSDKGKEKIKYYTDLTLKVTWFETVLEAKPQALLQTIVLLETTDSFIRFPDDVFNYLPIILSIWSIHAITNNIYALVVEKAGIDETPMFSRFYGYTYTVVSNIAPAMLINTARRQFESDLNKFLITLVTLVIYYVILFLVERFALIISNVYHFNYGKVFHGLVGVSYVAYVAQWILLNPGVIYTVRGVIVVSLYLLCLVTNFLCFLKVQKFADVSFNLKNELVKQQYEEIKKKYPSCFSSEEKINSNFLNGT